MFTEISAYLYLFFEMIRVDTTMVSTLPDSLLQEANINKMMILVKIVLGSEPDSFF